MMAMYMLPPRGVRILCAKSRYLALAVTTSIFSIVLVSAHAPYSGCKVSPAKWWTDFNHETTQVRTEFRQHDFVCLLDANAMLAMVIPTLSLGQHHFLRITFENRKYRFQLLLKLI